MRLVFYFVFSVTFLFSKLSAQEMWLENNDNFNSSMLELLALKNEEYLLELDSIKVYTNSTVPVSPEDVQILKRTKLLSKTIPLDYNDLVKSYIDKYTSANYRPYMNRLLGLSRHYFSIYEPILKESGIPEEVKFLSLVESSLNPHLVSTSGAVGPWQFMYVAAKEYNLEMSNYLDERKDPYSSSYAVSQYLLDAYSRFGDWLLALASYNCGRGCVQRAIARSGFEQPTFWELSPFLPQETRNYIPKYLAMTYVLSDPDFYDIKADSTELNLAHEAMMIDKTIDLTNVAAAIGIGLDTLKIYNPGYKKNLITGSIEKPKRLLLPMTEMINDSLLYLALNDTKPIIGASIGQASDLAMLDEVKKYQVKKGETIASISRKFGVSVQNIKVWNGLNSRSSVVGKTLIVQAPINEKLTKTVESAYSTKTKSSTLVYTVKKGDSLDRIASRHKGVTVSKLKADNGLKNDLIKPGMKLKVNKS